MHQSWSKHSEILWTAEPVHSEHNRYNSVLASGDFCHLLIFFANSLDPDQDQQNVGPDLDPNCLSDSVQKKFFLKNLILKKVSRQQQKHEKLPSMQRVDI